MENCQGKSQGYSRTGCVLGIGKACISSGNNQVNDFSMMVQAGYCDATEGHMRTDGTKGVCQWLTAGVDCTSSGGQYSSFCLGDTLGNLSNNCGTRAGANSL